MDAFKLMKSFLLFFLLFIPLSFAFEKAPPDLVKLAKTTLIEFGHDPVIINAVKSANKINHTPAEIIETEKLWQKKQFSHPRIKEIMNSSLSYYLKGFRKKHASIEEVYLLDHKGLLVATAKYEEMYQWGDEAGFKRAIKGFLHIGDVRIDDDENVYMVHVVLPVKDKSHTIGAMDIGLLLGKKK